MSAEYGAHGFLARYELQRHSQRVAQDHQVLLVSEPWGEVALLVRPDLAQVHGLETAEIGLSPCALIPSRWSFAAGNGGRMRIGVP